MEWSKEGLWQDEDFATCTSASQKYHNQSLLESTLPSRELLPSPKSSPGRTGESGPLPPPQDDQKSGDVGVPACQGEESG